MRVEKIKKENKKIIDIQESVKIPQSKYNDTRLDPARFPFEQIVAAYGTFLKKGRR